MSRQVRVKLPVVLVRVHGSGTGVKVGEGFRVGCALTTMTLTGEDEMAGEFAVRRL